jgi:putative nucleotidyltransferase with HDIG domain
MKLREHIAKLNKSIYTGERLKQNLVAQTVCGCIAGGIGTAMTVMNIIQHKGFVTVTTLLFALAGFFFIYSAKVLKKREPAVIISTVISIVMFTYYAISGTNEGFAILWTLIMPLLICYFMSVKYGILVSVYVEILIIVLFYTPLRSHFSELYTSTFMNRYPVLYMCMLMLMAVSMTQYHESVLVQLEYTERLSAEVKKQTRVATERADKLQRLSDEMVVTLAQTIDAKDRYTNGHSLRVAEYAALLAETLGWDEARIGDLKRDALLHDIGKIGVPDMVLNKPGRLTEDEFNIIKSHTVTGHGILAEMEDMTEAADVAMHHHERYDGSGYPSGKAGAAIPDNARIVAIADAFDAMYSNRIYRKALPVEDIITEMEKQRGRQFDPDYLDVFLTLIKNGKALEIGKSERV